MSYRWRKWVRKARGILNWPIFMTSRKFPEWPWKWQSQCEMIYLQDWRNFRFGHCKSAMNATRSLGMKSLCLTLSWPKSSTGWFIIGRFIWMRWYTGITTRWRRIICEAVLPMHHISGSSFQFYRMQVFTWNMDSSPLLCQSLNLSAYVAMSLCLP